MKKTRMILVALMSLAPVGALAHQPGEHPADPNLHVDPALKDCSVQFAPELTQAAFARFVREFGSVSAFKMSAPPTTLGRGGFAIGVEGIAFTVEERSDAWNDTFYHPDAYHELGAKKTFPKVRVRVGLSDRVDLGAYFARNPQANYGWLGLEGRYGVLRQGQDMPVSLVVRAAYTKTLYVKDMDMHAATIDVALGRTFWNVLTPYVAVGSDAILARETSAAVDLKREEQSVQHVLGGVEARLGHVALGAEAQSGDLPSFQVKLTTIF